VIARLDVSVGQVWSKVGDGPFIVIRTALDKIKTALQDIALAPPDGALSGDGYPFGARAGHVGRPALCSLETRPITSASEISVCTLVRTEAGFFWSRHRTWNRTDELYMGVQMHASLLWPC
jgi:hypothetical protein